MCFHALLNVFRAEGVWHAVCTYTGQERVGPMDQANRSEKQAFRFPWKGKSNGPHEAEIKLNQVDFRRPHPIGKRTRCKSRPQEPCSSKRDGGNQSTRTETIKTPSPQCMQPGRKVWRGFYWKCVFQILRFAGGYYV